MSINLFEDSCNQGNRLSLFKSFSRCLKLPCRDFWGGVKTRALFDLYLETLSFFPSSSFYPASTSTTQHLFPTNGFGSHNLQFNSLRQKTLFGIFQDDITCIHLLSQCYLMIFDVYWCIYVFLLRMRFDYTNKLISHEQIIGQSPSWNSFISWISFLNHVPSVIYPLKMQHCRKLDFEKLMVFFSRSCWHGRILFML